jgi:hypothetical protein
MTKRERKERKGDRMDDKDIEQEGQNGKRKGWGIEREKFFIFIFGIVSVIRNLKARRANKAFELSLMRSRLC